MTETGLRQLRSYLEGVYCISLAEKHLTVWREQLRVYSDAAIMGAARVWVSNGERRPPNAAVLSAGARQEVHPAIPSRALVRATEVRVSTMLAGDSEIPRCEGEPLFDYLERLRAGIGDEP